MEWITNNFPVVSGIVVALLSSISALLILLMDGI